MLSRRLLVGLAASLAAGAALAQTAPLTRIRGTIASETATQMTVTTREGQRVDIALNEPLTVSTVQRVDLAAIKPGDYVGIATRSDGHGGLRALEVLLFPAAMRGVGEGHYAWDLEPGSMMTNGTVSGTVQQSSGRELSVTYKGSTNEIAVPPDVPVVTLVPAQRADLKVGEKVFLSAVRNAQGALAASRVTVGKDGVAPPM